MQRYNPFIHAIASLTNAPARDYYADRALEDIGTIIWCINHACNAAYQTGKAFRAFAERTEANALQCTALTVAPCSAIAEDGALRFAPIKITDEVIDAEIVEEPGFWLLSASPEVAIQTKADKSETWILDVICPTIKILQAETTTQLKTSRSPALYLYSGQRREEWGRQA